MSGSNSQDCITVSLPGWDDNLSGDSIYISSGSGTSDTFTLSDLTYDTSANITLGGISVPWTTGTNIGSNGYTWNNQGSGKIQLNGEDADIEVNGESLMGMLRTIEDRLNILKPNETLESEWADLKALGDQYRALEKHIKEKQATFDKLKSMPPPDIL